MFYLELRYFLVFFFTRVRSEFGKKIYSQHSPPSAPLFFNSLRRPINFSVCVAHTCIHRACIEMSVALERKKNEKTIHDTARSKALRGSIAHHLNSRIDITLYEPAIYHRVRDSTILMFEVASRSDQFHHPKAPNF